MGLIFIEICLVYGVQWQILQCDNMMDNSRGYPSIKLPVYLVGTRLLKTITRCRSRAERGVRNPYLGPVAPVRRTLRRRKSLTPASKRPS